MPFEAGLRIASYEIKSLIGSGGMGEVYRAHDARLGRDVALKILSLDLAQNRKAVARFDREARAASALNHPNILHIYDLGEAAVESRHVHYIAMELANGETLRDILRRRRPDLPQVLEWLRQLGEGLECAHEAGIVHRDLKPENVIVTRDGFVKILDFGLAKLVEQKRLQLAPVSGETEETARFDLVSREGMVLGTIGYMSPEQATGAAVDARADIFSFGCILYELTTGRRAFSGTSSVDTLHKIVHGEPVSILDIDPSLPHDLAHIVRRCLEKAPADRYQTVREAAIELRNLNREISSGGTSGSGPTQQRALPHPKRRVRVLTTAAVLCTVVMITVFGWNRFVRSRAADDSQPAPPRVSANVKITRLTTSGRVTSAAISPDGKYVAYVEDDAGKRSVRLRHIETRSETELVAGSPVERTALTFTPDGGYVAYLESTSNSDALWSVDRVPVLGGRPQRLIASVPIAITNLQTSFAFSPDGGRLTYCRSTSSGHGTALAIADLKDRRETILFEQPGVLAHPYWSRDGRSILCDVEDNESKLFEIDLASGHKVRTLRSPDEAILKSALHVPDRPLLVGIGTPWATGGRAIYVAAYPSMRLSRLTQGVARWNDLSIDAHGETLVTVRRQYNYNLWSVGSDAGDAQQLTHEEDAAVGKFGVALAPGGVVYFSACMNGERTHIWAMDLDEGRRWQVTFGDDDEFSPTSSLKTPFVVYGLRTHSGKTQSEQIWRADSTGAAPIQLTSGTFDASPSLTPDGSRVLYVDDGAIADPSLRWVPSTEKGSPTTIAKGFLNGIATSPDSRLIAGFLFASETSSTSALVTFRIEDGKIIDRFPNVPAKSSTSVRWSPDGRGLIVSHTENGVSNLWLHPLDGGQPKQLTHLDALEIADFQVLPDGKHFLVSRGRADSDAILITDLFERSER